MKIKSIVLPIAVLAALSAVAYFTTRPTPPPVADARVGQPLVDRTVGRREFSGATLLALG